MKISIDVPDHDGEVLRRAAQRLGIPVARLAYAAVADLVGNCQADFERATGQVLRKNAELYRRLA